MTEHTKTRTALAGAGVIVAERFLDSLKGVVRKILRISLGLVILVTVGNELVQGLDLTPVR